MKIIIDGKTVELPGGGGGGGGGNPVGTVISFLGTSAPQGYLVCDGAEYEISAYPALAEFFLQQFGASNHFGGDGTATFAVPDMRNLFLRGYRGAAEEKLSGEIGAKQSGTQHPTVFQAFAGDFQAAVAVINDKKETVLPENVDDYQEKNDSWGRLGFAANNFATYGGQNVVGEMSLGKLYTARPANMAVLFCIKAVENTGGSSGGGSAEGIYSTEETRIGTWMGKPLYRKGYTFEHTLKKGTARQKFETNFNESYFVVNLYGMFSGIDWNDQNQYRIPYVLPENGLLYFASLFRSNNCLYIDTGWGVDSRISVTAFVEYTKTTD